MDDLKWFFGFLALAVVVFGLVIGYKVQKDTELAVACAERGGNMEINKDFSRCVLPSVYQSKEDK